MALELNPGTKLYGYCNGYFGRDSYSDKLVIACGTWGDTNWVVVEEGWGTRKALNMAAGFDAEDVERWKKKEEGDYE